MVGLTYWMQIACAGTRSGVNGLGNLQWNCSPIAVIVEAYDLKTNIYIY